MQKTLENKKILICIPFFIIGGAETQAFHFARHLKVNIKAEVEVWALSTNGPLTDFLDYYNITWRAYNFNFSDFHKSRIKKIKRLIQFAFSIRKSGFDLIIPYTYYPNVVCGFSRKISGVKACFWNQRGKEAFLGKAHIDHYAIKNNPWIISNSEAGRKYLAEKLLISQDKVHVIRNTYFPEKAKNTRKEWRTELGISEETVLGIMVANYFPEKDHLTLLKGLKKIVDAGYNFKLIFVGANQDKNLFNKNKAVAFDLNLYGHVMFIESNDISGLLESSDIAILSSVSEGSPNALIEYMYAGLPVIATNIDSISEIIGSDYKFLFEVGDENKFAELTISLINYPTTRREIGQENQQKIKKLINNQENFDKMILLINKILFEYQ